MRQYIRHPSEMPINYRLHAENNGPKAHADRLHDISSGGLSFHCTEAINPGRSLHIRISVQPPPFEADGIVMWCHQEKNGFQVGVRFDDSDIDFALRMIEQICHIEQYRNEILQREGRRLSSEDAAQEWISQYASSFP